MPTFTSEQWAFLKMMDKLYRARFEAHQRLIEKLCVQIGALQGVVIGKD